MAGEQSFAPHYILEVTRPERLDELDVIVETRDVLPPDAMLVLADRGALLIKSRVGVTADSPAGGAGQHRTLAGQGEAGHR